MDTKAGEVEKSERWTLDELRDPATLSRLDTMSSGDLETLRDLLYGYCREYSAKPPFLDFSQQNEAGLIRLIGHLMGYAFLMFFFGEVVAEPLLDIKAPGIHWYEWAVLAVFGVPGTIIAYYDYKRLFRPKWTVPQTPDIEQAGKELGVVHMELRRREDAERRRFQYGRE